MIKDTEITSRISSYSCCMGAAMYQRLCALRDGDAKKADALLQKALLLHWAIRVLKGYTLSDDVCKGEIPSTQGDVECAIKLADPCCPAPCECCEDVEDPALSCDIHTDGSADVAVVASGRLEAEGAAPADGDTFLITGGTDSLWVPGTIQTWDADNSVWVVTTLDEGDVIDVAGVLWLITSTGAVMYFPAYNMQLVDPNGTYQFSPFDPIITASQHRNVLIQAFHTTWLTVFETTEDTLYAGLSMAFGMLPFSSARVVYLWGPGCSMPVVVPVILPEQLTCGTVTATATTTTYSDEGIFRVTVSIADVVGYLLGNVDVVYNGTTSTLPATVGDVVYGPYPIGSSVSVTLHNANNVECDIDLGVQTVGPSGCLTTLQQATPVDALFEGSEAVGQTYFIYSDTTNAGNTWAGYVGFTVLNDVFTLVPVGGEVQLGSTPDSRIIWDGVDMLPFTPQMHGTYTNTDFYFISQYPAVHTLRSRNALVEMHSDANGWFTVYDGPESALGAVQSFAYNSLVSVMDTIRVTYSWGGCSIVTEGDDISVDVLPFVCAGDRYGSFTVPPEGGGDYFGIIATTSTDHFALRQINTIEVDQYQPDPGAWCLYPSDAAGALSGTLTSLDLIGNISDYTVDGYSTLTTLLVHYNDVLTELSDVSMLSALTTFAAEGLPQVGVALDLSSNAALTYMQYVNVPLLTSIPSTAPNTLLESYYLNSLPLITTLPAVSSNLALTSYQLFSLELLEDVPDLSLNVSLEALALLSLPLITSVQSMVTNTALKTYSLSALDLVSSVPALTANTALENVSINNMALLTTLPDFPTSAHIALISISCPLLTNVGTLPILSSVTIQNAALVQAAVDAVILACDDTIEYGTLNLSGGTTAAHSGSTPVTDKLAALASKSWTINLNP